MNLAQMKKIFSYLIKNNLKFKILCSDDIDYDKINIRWKYPPYYPRHYILNLLIKEIKSELPVVKHVYKPILAELEEYGVYFKESTKRILN